MRRGVERCFMDQQMSLMCDLCTSGRRCGSECSACTCTEINARTPQNMIAIAITLRGGNPQRAELAAAIARKSGGLRYQPHVSLRPPACVRASIRVCVREGVHACVHAIVCARTFVRVCARLFVRACVRSFARACVCSCVLRACMCASMCVCVHSYVRPFVRAFVRASMRE